MMRWLKKLCHRIKELKYGRKLYLVLGLVGLLPVITIGSYMVYGFRDILSGKEYEMMDVSLNQVCAALEKQSDIYRNLSDYLVFDQELRDILERSQTSEYDTYSSYVDIVDPVLSAPKFYHSGINRITIYADSIKIAHDTTLAPLSEIEGQKWFAQLTELDSMWVWADDEGEELLLVRKFPGFSEKAAYLGIYCDIDTFTESLGYFEKEGAGILLLDSRGEILRAESNDIDAVPKVYPADVKEKYQYTEQQVAGMPMSVSIYMEKRALYSEFQDMLLRIAGVVAVSVVLILLISRYMSRILVRRIERLTASVEQVEPNDMILDIEEEPLDEIGILIRSFHKMLGQIQSLIQKVYQSKITQQKLEMEALQAQINPHFLYNTLSMINWKAIRAGEKDISKIALSLSSFYRTTLNKGESFITVDGEIRNIRSYLEIQQMMHDYEFEVEYHIEVQETSRQIPKLILQPLVENALDHGIDLKEEGEKRITLSCREDAGDILFIIEDTGVGMDDDTLTKLTVTHEIGYGVNNVNDRLRILYGDAYGLQFTSSPGAGTEVRIRIPKNAVVEKDKKDERGLEKEQI